LVFSFFSFKFVYAMKKSFLFLLMAMAATAANATIYCVDSAVSTSGDGTSWATAFKTITEGINAAANDTDDDKTVYVRGGTYAITASLPQKAVKIYGSFAADAAGDATPADRPKGATGKPWEFTTPTVLDAASWSGGASDGVFEAATAPTALTLDGLTIQNRKIDNTDDNNKATVIIAYPGLTIQNCIIKDNELKSDGASGAIVLTGDAAGTYAIKDSKVSGNIRTSGNEGAGGLYLASINAAATVTITGCLFTENKGSSGAIYSSSYANGAVTVENTEFRANLGNNEGGAMRLRGGGSFAIIGSLFKENKSGESAGDYYIHGTAIYQQTSNLFIYSCVFDGNATVSSNTANLATIHGESNTVAVYNSIFCNNKNAAHFNSNSTKNIYSSMFDGTVPASADPINAPNLAYSAGVFTNAAAGDYTLPGNSPAKGAGKMGYAYLSWGQKTDLGLYGKAWTESPYYHIVFDQRGGGLLTDNGADAAVTATQVYPGFTFGDAHEWRLVPDEAWTTFKVQSKSGRYLNQSGNSITAVATAGESSVFGFTFATGNDQKGHLQLRGVKENKEVNKQDTCDGFTGYSSLSDDGNALTFVPADVMPANMPLLNTWYRIYTLAGATAVGEDTKVFQGNGVGTKITNVAPAAANSEAAHFWRLIAATGGVKVQNVDGTFFKKPSSSDQTNTDTAGDVFTLTWNEHDKKAKNFSPQRHWALYNKGTSGNSNGNSSRYYLCAATNYYYNNQDREVEFVAANPYLPTLTLSSKEHNFGSVANGGQPITREGTFSASRLVSAITVADLTVETLDGGAATCFTASLPLVVTKSSGQINVTFTPTGLSNGDYRARLIVKGVGAGSVEVRDTVALVATVANPVYITLVRNSSRVSVTSPDVSYEVGGAYKLGQGNVIFEFSVAPAIDSVRVYEVSGDEETELPYASISVGQYRISLSSVTTNREVHIETYYRDAAGLPVSYSSSDQSSEAWYYIRFEREYPANSSYRYLYDDGEGKPLIGMPPIYDHDNLKWKLVEAAGRPDTFHLVSKLGNGVAYAKDATGGVPAGRYYASAAAATDELYTIGYYSGAYWLKRVGGSGIDKQENNRQFGEYGSGDGVKLSLVAAGAVSPDAAITANPASLNLVSVTVGLPSVPQSVSVYAYNLTGSVTATLQQGDASPFALASNAPIAPDALAMLNGVAVSISAKAPAAAGTYTDTLVLSGAGATYKLPLSVTGVVTEIPVTLSPTVEPSEQDRWYYIYNPKRGYEVMQDMGAGANVAQQRLAHDNSNPAQLWKVVGITSGNYVIVSKPGNKLTYSATSATSGTFTAVADDSYHTFKFDKRNDGDWQIKDNAEDSYINKSGNDALYVKYGATADDGSTVRFYAQETAATDGLIFYPRLSLNEEEEYWYQISFVKHSSLAFQDNGQDVNISLTATSDTTAQYWKFTGSYDNCKVEGYAGRELSAPYASAASNNDPYKAVVHGSGEAHKFERVTTLSGNDISHNGKLTLKHISRNNYVNDRNTWVAFWSIDGTGGVLNFTPATPPAELAITEPDMALDFASSPIGVASLASEVTVAARNLGDDTVAYSIAGDKAALFSVAPAPGWSKKRGGTLLVTFTASDETQVNAGEAVLTVATPANAGLASSINLTGAGSSNPIVGATPATVAFTGVTATLASEPKPVTVVGAHLKDYGSYGTVSYTLKSGGSGFSLSSSAYNLTGETFTDNLRIVFRPAEAGKEYVDTLIIAIAGYSAVTPVKIALSGTGVAANLPVAGNNYYYIQQVETDNSSVLSGGFVQDEGVGNPVPAYTLTPMGESSLWKVESSDTTNKYKLVSKLGNELSFDGSSFTTAAAGSGAAFDFAPVAGKAGQWNIKYRGAEAWLAKSGYTYAAGAAFVFLAESDVAPLAVIPSESDTAEHWYQIEFQNKPNAAAEDKGLNVNVALDASGKNSANTAQLWKFEPSAAGAGVYKIVGYSGREFKANGTPLTAGASGAGDDFAPEWTATKDGAKKSWTLRNLTKTGTDVYLSSSSNVNHYGNHADRLLNIEPVTAATELAVQGAGVVNADSLPFGILPDGLSGSIEKSLDVWARNVADTIACELGGDNPDKFSVAPADGWNRKKGGSLTVTFAPQSNDKASYAATLAIGSAAGGKTDTLKLTGRVAPTATISVSVSEASWGNVTSSHANGSYEEETVVTLEAAATDTTVFTRWEDGSGVEVSTTPQLSVTLTQDTVLKAVFNLKPEKTITVAVNEAWGSVVPGAGLYREGRRVSFTATPADSATFAKWTNANNDSLSNEHTIVVVISEDATLTANFSLKPKHTVTLTVNDPALGSVSGSGVYYHGQTAGLQAIHSAAVSFDGWANGSGDIVSHATIITLQVLKDTALQAQFSATYAVTLSVNDAALGHITGSSSGNRYAAGSPVTLNAIPADSARFVSWTIDGDVQVSQSSTLNFAITQDTAFRANFVLKPKYAVEAQPNNAAYGSVAGSGAYFDGKDATLTATATDSTVFVCWTNADGDTVSTENPYAFTVAANVALTAAFALTELPGPEPAPLSGDATLQSLTVSAGTLTPTFNANVTEYAVSAPSNVASITLTATATHDSATVSGDIGQKPLSVGRNTFTITVTAEDATTTKAYTVTVTREAATGVGAVAKSLLRLYPNPVANGELKIENSELRVGEKIEVYSLSGSRVATYEVAAGAVTVINVSQLPQGVYVVKAGAYAARVSVY
jgi:hypothetical protein